MPPWPGSSTTSSGAAPVCRRFGRSASSAGSGSGARAAAGAPAVARKVAGSDGSSVTVRRAGPGPVVAIAAVATRIGAARSSTMRDQPGPNAPVRTAAIRLVRSKDRGSKPVQSTSEKSITSRHGSASVNRRHGTPWLSGRSIVTPAPSARAAAPSIGRASAVRSAAPAGTAARAARTRSARISFMPKLLARSAMREPADLAMPATVAVSAALCFPESG